VQAWATLTVSGLRALLLAAGAWFTGDLRILLWLLLAVVLVKLLLLVGYVHRRHGFGRPWFERATFSDQFRHSAPFGISNALYSLRGQSDQWVAASLFALHSFAAFSIAALVQQIVHIFRHSVMEAFLPSMSRMEAAGDVRGMMQMNSRANVMVSTVLYPVLAVAFVFAEEIITLIYTATYLEAAPVMRLYVVAMAAMVIEVGSLVLLLRQGAFALKLSAATLVVSVAASLTAAHFVGLTGAAAGSVLAIYVDRTVLLRRVSKHTGVPMRELQHWGALLRALVAAVLSGALAWVVVDRLLWEAGPFVRLVAGTAVLGAAYLIATWREMKK
jgi:O-antigen/teichoic acid export membrane protein